MRFKKGDLRLEEFILNCIRLGNDVEEIEFTDQSEPPVTYNLIKTRFVPRRPTFEQYVNVLEKDGMIESVASQKVHADSSSRPSGGIAFDKHDETFHLYRVDAADPKLLEYGRIFVPKGLKAIMSG